MARSVPLFWFLALTACQSATPDPGTPSQGEEPVAASPAAATLTSDSTDGIWEYLAGRYDGDGDGQITEEEYTRGGELERIDRNGDGVVTPEDFPEPQPGRGGLAGMSAERRQRMGAVYSARAVVLTYFQLDEDADGLTMEGLEQAFEQLDMDGSEALDEAEFACATDERPWAGPGQAWPVLLAGIDGPGNEDGLLDRGELEAYHRRMSGEAGVLRAPSRVARAGRRAVASDGAPVGSPAPDFTLTPPDGGEAATLSSWKGKKPVALIFGSYT